MKNDCIVDIKIIPGHVTFASFLMKNDVQPFA